MTDVEIVSAEIRQAEVPMSDALAAALDRLEQDAELYRWLRSRHSLMLWADGSKWARKDGSIFVASLYLAENGMQHAPQETFDATIRAAMILRAEQGEVL